MGLLRQFLTCKDVDKRVKYWAYATRPLNLLLWGSKSANINECHMKKLWTFQHTAIRCIIRIKWSQMQEQWITKEVQSRFLDIPNINTYIIRHTNKYIGKMIRANNDSLNKKLIGTWIFCPSNNNCMSMIQAIIPDISKTGKFSEWALQAQDDASWNAKINNYFAEHTTPESEEDLN